MSMIDFQQTSRFRSDETASYQAKLNEKLTLGEFIGHLLTGYKNEWGYVKIQDADCPLFSSTYQVEYRWGKIVSDDIPDELKQKLMPRVFDAEGGWSRMDYIIKLEQLKDRQDD